MMQMPLLHTIQNPCSGHKATFVETAATTQGAQTLVHMELSAGAAGPPMHYHTTFDECFTVIEGVLGLELGGQTLYLEKGDRCTAGKGTAHRFFNPSKMHKVIFSVQISPGNEGFETMLQVGYGLVNDGLTNAKGIPKNVEHLALIFVWGDTNLTGVFKFLHPVMKRVARRAMQKGVDQMLIDKYCRTGGGQRPGLSQLFSNAEEQAVYCL